MPHRQPFWPWTLGRVDPGERHAAEDEWVHSERNLETGNQAASCYDSAVLRRAYDCAEWSATNRVDGRRPFGGQKEAVRFVDYVVTLEDSFGSEFSRPISPVAPVTTTRLAAIARLLPVAASRCCAYCSMVAGGPLNPP